MCSSKATCYCNLTNNSRWAVNSLCVQSLSQALVFTEKWQISKLSGTFKSVRSTEQFAIVAGLLLSCACRMESKTQGVAIVLSTVVVAPFALLFLSPVYASFKVKSCLLCINSIHIRPNTISAKSAAYIPTTSVAPIQAFSPTTSAALKVSIHLLLEKYPHLMVLTISLIENMEKHPDTAV